MELEELKSCASGASEGRGHPRWKGSRRKASSTITPVVRKRPQGACYGLARDMREAEPNGQARWCFVLVGDRL